MKKALFTTLFLLTYFLSFSQSCSSLMKAVSLEERTSEATIIIEAEVISQDSYWDTQHHNIYTLHKLQVFKNAKGTSSSFMYVETLGGTIGEEMQTTSSSARLRVGNQGVFFLKSSNHTFPVLYTTYEMVAAAQGFIKYDKVDNTATDVFNKYTSVENDVYIRLAQTTNRSLQFVQERVSVNTSNSIFATPTISSFSPTTITAGTESILTINGSNFGATIGEVGFKYSSDGGASYINAENSQIVSWSDTQITVEIPTTAGTGTIRVTNTTAETGTSSGTLTVPYAHSSATGSGNHYPTTLQSGAGTGDFTFVYHTDFNSSAAKQYFEEAFGVWNCQSGVNFVFSGTTATDVTADDNINIVRFDNGSELPTGVLGRVTSRFLGTCPTTGRAIVDEMDITWNDSTNWYYGSGTPGGSQHDFKTVALHELGHAHQLGHVINSSTIMHYNLGAGVEKFNLNADDIDGANYTMGIFNSAQGCAGVNSMTVNSQCTYVPDDNFEAYLEVNNMGNGIANDDLVTTANISGVTTLSVISQGIADFTGIEDFTALETFFAFSNTMSSIDVTANVNLKDFRVSSSASLGTININTLTALEILDIASTNITNVDVCNNTALKTFWLSDTGIATLDVSNNIALEFLHLSNNTTITSLDLTVNTNLKSFYAQNSGLTYLDINNGNNTDITTFYTPGASSLGCINVDDAAYSTTNWTSIDAVSSFGEDCYATTYVPDDTFENYLETHNASGGTVAVGDVTSMGNGIANDDYVFTNRINTVTDLSLYSQAITDFTGLEDFTNLEDFVTTDATATSLDFTNNIKLDRIRCSYMTNLTSVNITGLTLLDHLYLYQTDLSVVDVSTNTVLTELIVSYSNLTSIDVSSNVLLEDLQLHESSIGTIDLSANTMLDNLTVSVSLFTVLDLTNNVLLERINC